MSRSGCVAVAAVLAVAGCTGSSGDRSALPYIRSAELTPEWLSDREANSPSMHRVATFSLTDQYGHVVTERSFAGKVTIAHFFFTTCGDVCPMTTSNIAALLRTIPDDPRLQVLSYSVTPDRDSVATLRAYATERGIGDPRWHLLTGTATPTLARTSFFVRLGDGTTYGVATIAHTESLVLVDGEGRLRGYYAGTLPLEMDRLREDVRTLIGELPPATRVTAAAR